MKARNLKLRHLLRARNQRRSLLAVLMAICLVASLFLSVAAVDDDNAREESSEEETVAVPDDEDEDLIDDEDEIIHTDDDRDPADGDSDGEGDQHFDVETDEDGNPLPGFNLGGDEGDGDSEAGDTNGQPHEGDNDNTPDTEMPEDHVGIWAPDVSIMWGDESFDLLDGVRAQDSEHSAIDEITVTDDGGFNAKAVGDYSVSYQAQVDEDEVYFAQRTVTVEPLGIRAAAGNVTVSDFATLKTALNDGGTAVITIDTDISFDDEVLTIKAGSDITLVGTSPSITLTQPHTRRHFSVAGTAKLTMRDLTLDGDGERGGVQVLNNGTFVLQEGGTIQNCDTDPSASGAAVHNSGTFLMEGGLIKDNRTTDDPQYPGSSGAGVENKSSGTFTMTGGTIRDNESFQGGGVSNSGTFLMDGDSALIDNNKADTGGGMESFGSFTLKRGTISNNSAIYGGGVDIKGGTFAMTGGAIADNTTNSTSFGGAGIRSTSSSIVMTISGGKVSGNTGHNGAGIYNMGHLTLSGSALITDNHSYSGGAVYNSYQGNLTIESGASITGNTATAGAGVLNVGTFVMNGGSISSNVASSYGGGIYQSTASSGGSSAIINGGTVSGNSATYGGGIYFYYSSATATLTLSGTAEISGNTAVDTGSPMTGLGGGIYTSRPISFAGATDVKISGNDAALGGGIYLSATTLDIGDGVAVNTNTASENGGGLYLYGASAVTMSGGAVSANVVNSTLTESHGGGGVYIGADASFDLSDGSIEHNKVESIYYGNGGGVYNSGIFRMSGGLLAYNECHVPSSTGGNGGGLVNHHDATECTITGGTIHFNRAGTGGGITSYSHLTISGPDVRIDNNTATSYGGGINTRGTLDLIDGTVSNNTAVDGGGIYVAGASTAIQGGSIEFNTASDSGGGIYNINFGAIITMSGGQIYKNTADVCGGGIATEAQYLYLNGNAVVSENSAGTRGGGIYLSSYSTLELSGNAEISKNTAVTSGGGVMSNNAFNMSGGKITGNTAADGGGIYNKRTFSMTAGLIDGNQATGVDGKGGGLYNDSSAATSISGGSFTGNIAVWGGGIYHSSSNPLSISGSTTLSGNEAATDGGAVYTTDLDKVEVGAGVTFSANKASAFFSDILAEDLPVHQSRIQATQFTGSATYAYNNYDINYNKVPPTSTLSFDAGGGTGSIAPITGTVGDTTTIPNGDALTKGAHHFVGWTATPNGTTADPVYAPGETYTFPSSDLTLYAVWEANPTSTLTYHPNGGNGTAYPVTMEVGDSTSVLHGELAGELAFSKTGHYFVGWGTSAGATVIDSAFAPGSSYVFGNTDVTLYAVWLPQHFELKYDANGASGNPPQSRFYSYGTEVTVAGKGGMYWKGHEFLGWSTSKNASTPDYTRTGTKLLMQKHTELFAVWAEGEYTLTYDGNGADSGDAPDGEIFYYRERIKIEGNTGNLVKEGFHFRGWSTDPEATVAEYVPGNYYQLRYERNLTLYAVWVPVGGNTATITVHHMEYGSDEDYTAATVRLTEEFQAAIGQPFTASAKPYSGYEYQPAISSTQIDSVSGDETLTLYYQQVADGLVLTLDDNVLTLEVVDNRLANYASIKTIPTADDLVQRTNARLLLDGNALNGVTYTVTPDLADVAFHDVGDVDLVLSASWGSGSQAQTLTADVRLTIQDTTPPEILLVNEELTVYTNNAPATEAELYRRIGVGATDNYTKTFVIDVTYVDEPGGFSAIDWSVAGQQYVLYFDTSDDAGNPAQTREAAIITVRSSTGGGGNSGGGTDRQDNHDGRVIANDGTPLGTITVRDGQLIFDSEVPLTGLPKTGGGGRIPLALAGILLLGFGAWLSRKSARQNISAK